MKVLTPEGYTFITKFQEDNSLKVLRSVDFLKSNSMKSSSTLFAGIWGPLQVNFFAYYVGPPLDVFLRILYRGPPGQFLRLL